MSRASGAERRKRLAAKVAAGAVPGRRASHYQAHDVRAAMQSELAAHQVAIDNQQNRARDKQWAFRAGVKPGSVSRLERSGGPCPSLKS